MHDDLTPRTRELLNHLDRSQEAFDDAIATVPDEWRARRPGAERWSVAEIIEHLAIVEQRVAQVLEEKVEALRAAGGLGVASEDSVLRRIDARLPDRSSRFRTNPASEPAPGVEFAEAIRKLEAVRARTRQFVITLDGADLGGVSHSHPKLGTFDGYEWVLFMGGHQQRHAAQIREVGEELAAAARAESSTGEGS